MRKDQLMRPGTLAYIGGATLLLSIPGCSWGTTKAEIEGTICGQPFKASYRDGKERDGLEIEAVCADGSSVKLSTTGTRAFEGQGNVASVVGSAVEAAVKASAAAAVVK